MNNDGDLPGNKQNQENKKVSKKPVLKRKADTQTDLTGKETKRQATGEVTPIPKPLNLAFDPRKGKKGEKVVFSVFDPDMGTEKMHFSTSPPVPQFLVSNKQKHEYGVLVIISVPFQEEYRRGIDRHPMKLIKKYIKAIYPDLSEENEEAVLQYAREKLRIVLCVNTKNNYVLVSEKREEKIKAMSEFVDELNLSLVKINCPASIIKAVWGPNLPGCNTILKTTEEIEAEKKFVNLMAETKWDKPPKQRFPFASLRNYTMQHPSTQKLLIELGQTCQHIMVMTGDADLVSLHPTQCTIFNSEGLKTQGKKSIFDSYFQQIKAQQTLNGNHPIRIGGAYCFDLDEISRHLDLYKECLSQATLGKSAMITYLAKTIDTATRKLVSKFEGVPYFAEPNVMMSLYSFNKQHLQNRNKEGLLDVTYNERLGGNPDWTQKITEFTRQEKYWAKNLVHGHQFLASFNAQLVSSSRHDLVIFPQDMEEFNAACSKRKKLNDKKTIIMNPSCSTLENLFKLKGQHNNQITESQLNSRFKEAGYGNSVIHALIHGMSSYLPYTYYMWYDSSIGISKKLGIGPKRNEINIPPPLPFTMEPREGVIPFLKNVMDYMSQIPRSFIVLSSGAALKNTLEELVAEVRSKKTTLEQENLPKGTFSQNMLNDEAWNNALQALAEIELLFRWSVSVMDYIHALDAKFIPELKNPKKDKGSDYPGKDYKDFSIFSKVSSNSSNKHDNDGSDRNGAEESDYEDAEFDGDIEIEKLVQRINVTHWYDDRDISTYLDVIIENELGGYQQRDNSHLYHNFLLAEDRQDSEDGNIYLIAVTPAVRTHDPYGRHTPINYFLDKDLQPGHLIADHLIYICNFCDLKLIKLIHQTENKLLEELTNVLKELTNDDTTIQRIAEELIVCDFDLEQLKNKIESLNAYNVKRDVFDEIMPEILKSTDQMQHAKIIFSYNLSDSHWITAEIQIHKYNNDYGISIFAHDPQGGGLMDEQQAYLIGNSMIKRIKIFDVNAQIQFNQLMPSPYNKRQSDGDSCGVICCDDQINRICGRSLNLAKPYAAGAWILRESQLRAVMLYLLEDDPARMFFINRCVNNNNIQISFQEKTSNYFGYSSLENLVEKGQLSDLQSFFGVHENININRPNRSGQTILHIAASLEDGSKLQFLLEYDNRGVNNYDNNGNTPLHIAAYLGNIKAINLLYANQANPGLLNFFDEDYLAAARLHGHQNIPLLLPHASTSTVLEEGEVENIAIEENTLDLNSGGFHEQTFESMNGLPQSGASENDVDLANMDVQHEYKIPFEMQLVLFQGGENMVNTFYFYLQQMMKRGHPLSEATNIAFQTATLHPNLYQEHMERNQHQTLTNTNEMDVQKENNSFNIMGVRK